MHARFTVKPELAYYVMSGAMTFIFSTMFVYLVVFYFTIVRLNPLQLVLVGTVLEASIFIFELPTGVVADIYSRRLSVILGIFTLGMGFITTGIARSFAIVLVSQIISGLGYTFLSGAEDAWLVEEVGGETIGRIYLRSGQINRVMGICGTVISAVLASFRLDLPIIGGGGMFLLLGLLLVFMMPENHFKPFLPQNRTRGLPAMIATFQEGARIIRGRPFLLSLVVINFFVGASSEGFDRLGDAHLVANFVFPALSAPLLGPLKPIVWFSIFNLAGSVLSLLVVEGLRSRLETLTTDLSRSARTLVILTLIFAALGIGFALAGSFPFVVTCLLLRGLIGALIWPIYNAYQTRSVPSHVRATILSITGQGNAIGQVLGGPLVGWIGTASLRAALVIAGLFILPNSFLYRNRDTNNQLIEEVPLHDQENVKPELE